MTTIEYAKTWISKGMNVGVIETKSGRIITPCLGARSVFNDLSDSSDIALTELDPENGKARTGKLPDGSGWFYLVRHYGSLTADFIKQKEGNNHD